MSSISKTSLAQFFDYCVEKEVPFAFYKLPDNKIINVTAQAQSTPKKIYQSSSRGFLFAPFQQNNPYSTVLIQPDIYTTENLLPKLNFAVLNKAANSVKYKKPRLKKANKIDFQKYVKGIKKKIKKEKFSKIVAARVAFKKKPVTFSPVAYFKKLCKKYPSAFVSLVYTKPYGLWIGASPEILLQANGNSFKTYALAGTKVNNTLNSKKTWGKKEKEEQKIVSDYIKEAFKTILKSTPEIKGPETVAAGNLLHLRTTFIYKSIPASNWMKVIKELHPTPAVAGLPKQKAIDYIIKNEKSPRLFYSGYLGPVNLDGQINLFVNLRCMTVLKNKLAIYAGCGITADSNPADEWRESKGKIETLTNLL